MITASELSDQIDAFLTASGMSATRFGKDALKDPSFVFNLRKGRVPNLDTAGQVIRFMDARASGATGAEMTSEKRVA